MRVWPVAAVLAVVLIAAASACGGGSSASDRIAGCEKRFLAGMANSAGSKQPALAAVAKGPVAHRTASSLCAAAESEGVLDDHGDASAGELRSVLRKHPALISPLCAAAFRAGLSVPASQLRPYLPRGGLRAISAKLCGNLAPYVNNTGGFDQAELFRDRGKAVLVPVCAASSMAAAAKSSSVPFSQVDQAKLFGRICAEAWKKGLLRTTGKSNQGAIEALANQIQQQMVASGEITVQP
jgi:hypothetical protein